MWQLVQVGFHDLVSTSRIFLHAFLFIVFSRGVLLLFDLRHAVDGEVLLG